MPDFLNLPSLRTINATDNGDHYLTQAEGLVVPTKCPICATRPLYRHGKQRQAYMDTPMHGKRVLIEIDRQRYRCKTCGKTLFEPLPDIHNKRLTTNRLIAYVEQHCLKKTFADISREVGVDEKTIKHIFDDYIAHLKNTVHFETPEILGIDELKIIGDYRAMITNVEKLTLYDMLPTRKKADLINYFRKMPDKSNVQALTMDLWNQYRQVARDQFPGRMIIADRFHVVRMANEAVEKVRKAIRKNLERKDRLKLKDDRFILLSRQHNLSETAQEKLEIWKTQYPELVSAYFAKEAFHDIYSHGDKDDAMNAAKEWDAEFGGSIDWAFRETRTALHNWWEEIFNYYDIPISNAYTESVNNLAKGMNRMGRGYSFEVIRARLIYDSDARKDGRTVVRKKKRQAISSSDDVFTMHKIAAQSQARYETVSSERSIEYGAYIPTLVRKLEAGEFE